MYIEVKTQCDFRKYTFIPANYRHDLVEYWMTTLYRFGAKPGRPRIPKLLNSLAMNLSGYIYTYHHIFRLFVANILYDAYKKYAFKPNGGYPWH